MNLLVLDRTHNYWYFDHNIYLPDFTNYTERLKVCAMKG